MTCAFPTCEKPCMYRVKGLCHAHYMQARSGKPLVPIGQRTSTDPDVVIARLMRKAVVDEATGCWVWQGYVGTHGYGTVRSGGKSYQAHRLSYLLLVGELPDGSVVHHKCNVKMCINPEHLQAVTPHENVAEAFERSVYRKRIKELEEKLEACQCGVAS